MNDGTKVSETALRSALQAAIEAAREGVSQGHGGPFGAAVLRGDEIIAVGHNTVLRDCDPTRHAEMNALTAAGKRLKSPHLSGCVLVATSEPCPMCLAATYWANVDQLVYCLPKEVAAGVGFTDAFIYEELGRAPEQRRLKTVQLDQLTDEAEAVFKEWQERSGQLY